MSWDRWKSEDLESVALMQRQGCPFTVDLVKGITKQQSEEIALIFLETVDFENIARYWLVILTDLFFDYSHAENRNDEQQLQFYQQIANGFDRYITKEICPMIFLMSAGAYKVEKNKEEGILFSRYGLPVVEEFYLKNERLSKKIHSLLAELDEYEDHLTRMREKAGAMRDFMKVPSSDFITNGLVKQKLLFLKFQLKTELDNHKIFKNPAYKHVPRSMNSDDKADIIYLCFDRVAKLIAFHRGHKRRAILEAKRVFNLWGIEIGEEALRKARERSNE